MQSFYIHIKPAPEVIFNILIFQVFCTCHFYPHPYIHYTLFPEHFISFWLVLCFFLFHCQFPGFCMENKSVTLSILFFVIPVGFGCMKVTNSARWNISNKWKTLHFLSFVWLFIIIIFSKWITLHCSHKHHLSFVWLFSTVC